MNLKITGIILAIIGLLMVIYTGFHYITTEQVVDLGPLKINQEKTHYIQWPPIFGAMLLVGGFAVIVFSKKRSA
jgi:hypothetical protein